MKAAINPKYPGALHLTDTVAPCCYKYAGAQHQKENYLKAAINPKYAGALHLTDTRRAMLLQYAGAQHQI